jgi:GMP reductase
MTGVGVPQLSGIIECSDAANGIGGHIIADGGCVYPGDVSKAFGAGAHFTMLGGMLAGHDEGGGAVTEKYYKTGEWRKNVHTLEGIETTTWEDAIDQRKFMQFYGMSSDAAMGKHGSRKDGYRGAEGKVVELPYRGPVEGTLTEILGGIRSTCTYIGAKRIKDMSKCTTFVRCTQQVNQVFNQYNAG